MAVTFPHGGFATIFGADGDGGKPSKTEISAWGDAVEPAIGFSTIAALAASTKLQDGATYTVDAGDNGQPETFTYDASSTATADGALIVTAAGMGVGRLISKRTRFATDAEMQADLRSHDTGTILQVPGFSFLVVGSASDRQTDGGVHLTILGADDAVDLRALGAVLNGVTDEKSLLLAAWDHFDTVIIPRGYVLALGSMVDVPAGKKIRGRGKIGATLSFTDNALFAGPNGLDDNIRNITLVGTNVPAPTGAYSSGSYAGCAIELIGASGAEIATCKLRDVEFEDFQAGAVNAYYVTTVEYRDCVARDMQKYTANATVGVFASFEATLHIIQRCEILGYNWKGFYSGNAVEARHVDCPAVGGVAGHASHYGAGCGRIDIIGGSSDVGFGIKAFECDHVEAVGFVSRNSLNGGFYTQGCAVVRADVTVIDPAAKAILIESLSGGSDIDAEVSGEVIYTTTVASSNGTALYIGGHSGITIKIKTPRLRVRGAFYGVWCPKASGAIIDADLRGLDFGDNGSGQYNILGYFRNLSVEGYLDHGNAQPAIFAAAQPTVDAGTFDFSGLRGRSSSASSTTILLASGSDTVRLDSLVVNGIVWDTCDELIVYDGTTTGDFINHIRIADCHVTNINQIKGILMELNGTTGTSAGVFKNNLLERSNGALCTAEIVGWASITNSIGVLADNLVGAFTTS